MKGSVMIVCVWERDYYSSVVIICVWGKDYYCSIINYNMCLGEEL